MKKAIKTLFRGIVVVSALFISFPTLAAEAPTVTTSGTYQDDELKITIAPYLFLINMKGTMTIRNTDMAVDVNLFDILKVADSLFAYQQHTEFEWGDFGIFNDFTYLDVGIIQDGLGPIAGATSLALDLEFFQTELGAFYTISRWDGQTSHGPSQFQLDLLAGFRYTYYNIGMTITPPVLPAVQLRDTMNIFDPIVGARVRGNLGEKWIASARTDVGGFGVGSDFTWNGVVQVGRRFKVGTWNLVGHLGYRGLYQDYSNGVGANRQGLDLWSHGPLIGVSGKL